MFNSSTNSIVIFIVCVVIVIAFLSAFIITIVYLYQKKHLAYLKEMEDMKERHRQALILSQVEIQEQTFQNITRDIHNSIGNKLVLAKEFLETLDCPTLQEVKDKVNMSVGLLSAGMTDLRDMARSMSSEIIANNGLIKALEFEVLLLEKAKLYTVNFFIEGDPIFLSANQELILFRIAQQAFNNIIKHAKANKIDINLQYTAHSVKLLIKDNGVGFNKGQYPKGNGLISIQKRAKLLNGHFQIRNDYGANLLIEIPIDSEESSPETNQENQSLIPLHE